MLYIFVELSCISAMFVGVSAAKLESWLDEQDEDLNDLREELKEETKQHENTLRVTVVFLSSSADCLQCFDTIGWA